MTHFEGGPAHGQTLMLKRSPFFLRVVEDKGAFDALDQLDDQPRPGEKLYAYRREGEARMVHVNTGRKPGGGFYPMATYRFMTPQPSESDMADRDLWRQWCRQNMEDRS